MIRVDDTVDYGALSIYAECSKNEALHEIIHSVLCIHMTMAREWISIRGLRADLGLSWDLALGWSL